MTAAVVQAPGRATVRRALNPRSARESDHATSDQPHLAEVGGAEQAHKGHLVLVAAQRAMQECATVGELFACASDRARGLGFARAIVASVVDRGLSAEAMGAPAHPESDHLRRRLLQRPVALRPRCHEMMLIECVEAGRAPIGRGASVLAEQLGLEMFTFGAIMPEHRVLALLVLERPTPAVRQLEHDLARMFGCLVGAALERLVLRERINEFAAEMKFLTSSAQALAHEAVDAPLAYGAEHAGVPVCGRAFPASSGSGAVQALFTARERDIAEQLVAGRSNRQIAAELQISPETVKAYVTRVRRKLDAANRADAAVRYLRLVGCEQ
jgi:DNA-binding CsgD family transcriptional regulator